MTTVTRRGLLHSTLAGLGIGWLPITTSAMSSTAVNNLLMRGRGPDPLRKGMGAQQRTRCSDQAPGQECRYSNSCSQPGRRVVRA